MSNKGKKLFHWCKYREPGYDDLGKWVNCMSRWCPDRECWRYSKLTENYKCPYFEMEKVFSCLRRKLKMDAIELAELYMRFWKWYNDNIGIVDFRIIDADVKGRSKEYILQKFKDRKHTIKNLIQDNFYPDEFKSKLYLLLQPLNSQSAEELSLKLTIRGY